MYNAEVREKSWWPSSDEAHQLFSSDRIVLTHAARNAERSGYGSKNRD